MDNTYPGWFYENDNDPMVNDPAHHSFEDSEEHAPTEGIDGYTEDQK